VRATLTAWWLQRWVEVVKVVMERWVTAWWLQRWVEVVEVVVERWVDTRRTQSMTG
jgi:hypothetical protein